MATSSAGRVRVLVVGPFAESGGLARVARQTTEGFDPRRFAIATCEASKDTPRGRSLFAACRSHLRRWTRLIRALRAHRPHVAHLHTCSYGTFYRTLLDAFTCRLLHVPFVLHVHGGLFADFLSGLRGIRRTLVTAGLQRAARVVVLSPSWRTRLTQRVAGMRLAVIPNGLEVLPSLPHSAERGGGVLFVGDLSDTKRPEDLLVAYAALPAALREEFPLVLVGDGADPRRRLLTELARRLEIHGRVRFAGPLPHAEVQVLLARADAYVVCSQAEGMPLALLEAMAGGAAIIGTAVGAIPEMVTDGREALLVPPLDPQALAAALRQLLSAPDLRRSLGEAARQRAVAGYSPTAFRTAIGSLWSEIGLAPGKIPAGPVPRLAAVPSHALR